MDVRVCDLKEKHLNQSADVLTRSLIGLNTIWKSFQPQYSQIYPILRAKILPSLAPGWSHVLLRKEKVVGVCVHYDLLDYLQTVSMPTHLPMFQKLGDVGKKLEQSLDITNIKKGDAIYGLFGVIDPDESGKGYSFNFWWHLFAEGKLAGWKAYYSRISNPVSLKMLQKLGAEIVGEAEVVDMDDPIGYDPPIPFCVIDAGYDAPA